MWILLNCLNRCKGYRVLQKFIYGDLELRHLGLQQETKLPVYTKVIVMNNNNNNNHWCGGPFSLILASLLITINSL